MARNTFVLAKYSRKLALVAFARASRFDWLTKHTRPASRSRAASVTCDIADAMSPDIEVPRVLSIAAPSLSQLEDSRHSNRRQRGWDSQTAHATMLVREEEHLGNWANVSLGSANFSCLE